MVLCKNFSPEKSLHIKCEQVSLFFSPVFGIANQLLTRNSPFAPLGQVDE